jgi:hypothetical protein
MPKSFTCGTLDTREERATAEIRTDRPITWRWTPSIASRITATASRHVPIKAMTAATGRAIAVIWTTETVLSLVDTIDLRTVALNPTQRELVIGDRGQIPFTSHPPYPGRGQANITDTSRRVHVYCRGHAVNAQVGREEAIIIIREISIHL